MKNLLFFFATTVLGLVISQSGVSATKNQDSHAEQGTFTVELTKSLDSKKVKEGDPVEAKLTGGITFSNGAIAARGAKVIGHVTQAKARSKNDSESTLEISFDKVTGSGGEETSISGTVLAAAPSPDVQTGSAGLADGYSGLAEITTRNTSIGPSGQSTPTLNDQSRGVLGINNLKLTDGVFTSTAKQVKLDSGTRILLSVSMAK
jgi:hypothetical protein